MIIYRHGQRDFCAILPDDILIQHLFDLRGGGDLLGDVLFGQVVLIFPVIQNAVAKGDALIADIGSGAGNDPADLILMLAAEGAADALFVDIVVFRHEFYSS